VPVVSMQYSSPRTFVWFPLAGLRHAIDARDRNMPLGAPMLFLCGSIHPRGPDCDIERFWSCGCPILGHTTDLW